MTGRILYIYAEPSEIPGDPEDTKYNVICATVNGRMAETVVGLNDERIYAMAERAVNNKTPIRVNEHPQGKELTLKLDEDLSTRLHSLVWGPTLNVALPEVEVK